MARGDGQWAADLRELTDEEPRAAGPGGQGGAVQLRFQMATGQMGVNRRLRTVRHDIARVYTVMRERDSLPAAPSDNEGAA